MRAINLTLTMCVLFAASSAAAKTGLSYAGEYIVPATTKVAGVDVAELSALVWDAGEKVFYAISDSKNKDRNQPASLYTFAMDLTPTGITGVNFLTRRPLLDGNGKELAANSLDAEGLALTPDGQSLLWSSELGSPLRASNKQGLTLREFGAAFTEKFAFTEGATGVRKNAAWESLSFTPDGKTMFMALEGSLKQDGDVATAIHSGTSRLLKFSNTATGMEPVLQQEFLYITDAVPQVTPYGVNDNGVSDILAINDHTLLFIERSGRNVSQGFNDWDFNIRVYLVDISDASDISKIDALHDYQNASTLQTARKKLLIDFSDYTTDPDCIEGVAFGPLIDGKKTLIFVSDNNQQPHQKTKFYLFIDHENMLQ